MEAIVAIGGTDRGRRQRRRERGREKEKEKNRRVKVDGRRKVSEK